jgi:hypothetical protein
MNVNNDMRYLFIVFPLFQYIYICIAAGENWISCLLANHDPSNINAAQVKCGETQSVRPGFFLAQMLFFVVIGTNHFVFIVYGITEESLLLWRKLLKEKFNIDFSSRDKPKGTHLL